MDNLSPPNGVDLGSQEPLSISRRRFLRLTFGGLTALAVPGCRGRGVETTPAADSTVDGQSTTSWITRTRELDMVVVTERTIGEHLRVRHNSGDNSYEFDAGGVVLRYVESPVREGVWSVTVPETNPDDKYYWYTQRALPDTVELRKAADEWDLSDERIAVIDLAEKEVWPISSWDVLNKLAGNGEPRYFGLWRYLGIGYGETFDGKRLLKLGSNELLGQLILQIPDKDENNSRVRIKTLPVEFHDEAAYSYYGDVDTRVVRDVEVLSDPADPVQKYTETLTFGYFQELAAEANNQPDAGSLVVEKAWTVYRRDLEDLIVQMNLLTTADSMGEEWVDGDYKLVGSYGIVVTEFGIVVARDLNFDSNKSEDLGVNKDDLNVEINYDDMAALIAG